MRLSDRPVRRRGSWKRVIWYLILLVIILIMMWKMSAIVRWLPV